jgi:hypothetical protein
MDGRICCHGTGNTIAWILALPQLWSGEALANPRCGLQLPFPFLSLELNLIALIQLEGMN